MPFDTRVHVGDAALVIDPLVCQSTMIALDVFVLHIGVLIRASRGWSLQPQSKWGEVGIRAGSRDLLSPALRWGESKANPNRPTWQPR